jgi:hypothetical protein
MRGNEGGCGGGLSGCPVRLRALPVFEMLLREYLRDGLAVRLVVEGPFLLLRQ